MSIKDTLVYVDTMAKIESVMEQFEGKNVRVAYSGGSDSDIVMWLLRQAGYNVKAVTYNVGIEYEATWRHLDYMRSLGFDIEVINAKMPIPTSNRRYGQPLFSKNISDMIQRFQRHNFDFQKDGLLSYEELLEKYPRCKNAIRWWTNNHFKASANIKWNAYLKEFLVENPIPFKVSNKCCDGAKKKPMADYAKQNKIDLIMLGLRKAEGGQRASYKSCFIPANSFSYSMYFPIFWWKKEDKDAFTKEFNIKHSDCYSVYKMPRTGCPGCPFGKGFEDELLAISEFEPRLEKGIKAIFGQAYEFTRKYRAFREEKKAQGVKAWV